MTAYRTILFATMALAIGVSVPSHAQTAKTLGLFAREPHTGPVEQTMVGVTTRFRSAAGAILEERHGSGIVLRCDGFVLFSAAMLDHRADEPDDVRPSIEITLRPGAAEERKIIAGWPKSIPSNLSLRMVKLADIHTPALRTLLIDALKPGDPVSVVWQPWDESSHRFGPIQRRAVRYARSTRPANTPWIELFDAPSGS